MKTNSSQILKSNQTKRSKSPISTSQKRKSGRMSIHQSKKAKVSLTCDKLQKIINGK